MSDVWSPRAQAFRDSDVHREGRDLDLLVEWAAEERTALDVATGGGHVARRLREAGLHFGDIDAAVGEFARVSRSLVLVEDLLYDGEEAEEAHRIRDPSHVRALRETEWRDLFESAGLDVETIELFSGREIPYQPWLERVGCRGEEAERVRELLGDRIAGDQVRMPRIAIKGRKRG